MENNFEKQNQAGEHLASAIKILLGFGFTPLIEIPAQSFIMYKAGDDQAGAIIYSALRVRYEDERHGPDHAVYFFQNE